MAHVVGIKDAPESKEVFKFVTLVEQEHALQMEENQTPGDYDGDSEYKSNSILEATEIHN